MTVVWLVLFLSSPLNLPVNIAEFDGVGAWAACIKIKESLAPDLRVNVAVACAYGKESDE
jgi:hypothetical protein